MEPGEPPDPEVEGSVGFDDDGVAGTSSVSGEVTALEAGLSVPPTKPEVELATAVVEVAVSGDADWALGAGTEPPFNSDSAPQVDGAYIVAG